MGMLFGKGALEDREPFGMKRLSAEARCSAAFNWLSPVVTLPQLVVDCTRGACPLALHEGSAC